MRYRLMATYRGVPYEAGLGPTDADVVLFAACPPPEDLGFEPATGHWRKPVTRAEVALWESRPTGMFRGEPCLVLDDLGDRLHIAYLGDDPYQAARLGYHQVEPAVFEVVTSREAVTELTEERVPHQFQLWQAAASWRPPEEPRVPPSLDRIAAPLAETPVDRSDSPLSETARALPLAAPAAGLPPAEPDAVLPRSEPLPAEPPDRPVIVAPLAGAVADAVPAAPPAGPAVPAPRTGHPLEPIPAEPAAVRAEPGPEPRPAATHAEPGLEPRPAATPAGPGVTVSRAEPAEPEPMRSRRGRAAGRARTETRWIFSELASLAAIPPAAYAVDEEVDGATCLVRTEHGFEVFTSSGGARHEVRLFHDEEAAYFYLFGLLTAEAVRDGRLVPLQR